MNPIDLNLTVGQIVVENPALASVFERHGIDYCDHGRTPLIRACSEHSLDPQRLIAELEETETPRQHAGEIAWAAGGVGELADHIVATHHRYLKEELPRLAYLVKRVEAAHGDRHPELRELHATFESFRSEMESHMVKEEAILFRLFKRLENAEERPSVHYGVVNRITRMECEHTNHAQLLARMRALTSDYSLPGDGCNTYRIMLHRLERLEVAIHEQMQRENSILFVRALALNKTLAEAESGVSETARLRQRPAERFSAPEHQIDLCAVADELRQEIHPAISGRRQETLFKRGSVTVTLFVFDRGGRLDEHVAPSGSVSIHVLSGSLNVETATQTHALLSGTMLLLAPGVRHSLYAVQATQMLLTVSLE